MTNSFQKLLKTCSKSFSKTKSKVHADPSTSSAQEELRVTSTSSGSNRFSAFSLIEISVVILIIGILVAGVTQSSKLIKYSRLNSARSLTQSSPVAGISDLMLWYETSLESSFESTEQSDGATVTTWYDNNPQSTVKNNASLDNGDGGTACAGNPIFYESVFNGGIPAIRFDGVNDCLRFSGADLIGADYTVFVVEQKRAATGTSIRKHFIAGTGTAAYSNLHFGYTTSSTDTDKVIRFSSYSNDLSYTSSNLLYTNPTPRIHTGIFSSTLGRSYWLNGGTNAETSDSTLTAKLVSYSGASLARYQTTNFYNGDIAEIIIYTRALKTEERQAIETYLGKKYAITIS